MDFTNPFGGATHTVLGPMTTQSATLGNNCLVFAQQESNPLFSDSDALLALQWGLQCARTTGLGAMSHFPASSCYPEDFASHLSAGGIAGFMTMGIYSPGLVCPLGWSAACTSTYASGGAKSTGGLWNGLFPDLNNVLKPGESMVGCCPTGYNCAEVPWNCISTPSLTLKSGDTFTTRGFDSNCETKTTTITVPATGMPNAAANRLNLVVPTGSTFNDKSSGGGKGGQGEGDGQGSSTGGGGGGLSTGAKIGIGVAVPVVCLAAIAVALFFILRRRKRASSKAAENQGNAAHPPMDADQQKGSWAAANPVYQTHDMGGGYNNTQPWMQQPQQYSEMGDNQPPRQHELMADDPGAWQRHELSGNPNHVSGPGPGPYWPPAELPGAAPTQEPPSRREQ